MNQLDRINESTPMGTSVLVFSMFYPPFIGVLQSLDGLTAVVSGEKAHSACVYLLPPNTDRARTMEFSIGGTVETTGLEDTLDAEAQRLEDDPSTEG